MNKEDKLMGDSVGTELESARGRPDKNRLDPSGSDNLGRPDKES